MLCSDNSPDLNVKKTKAMLTDFRKAPTVISDLFIDGVNVEGVTECKYLGTVSGNKLHFNKNTDFIYKRCQPRIFLPSKAKISSCQCCCSRTFYRSCIESVLACSFLCWFGGLNVKSSNVPNKAVNECGKAVGERQEHLSQLYERRVVRKASVTVDDNSHVLAKYCELHPSGGRFRVPKSDTVNTISEQIKLFKNKSSVCVCVCVCVSVSVCVCVSVCVSVCVCV